MTVAAILKHKGHEVVSVRATDKVGDVACLLSQRHIGAVVILDVARQLLGILSERDIVNAIAAKGAQALDMTAGQLMTRSLMTATLHTTVSEAMAMMTSGRFRHLPVLEGEDLVGLISIGDVVKVRMMEQESEVDGLRAYVAGAF